MDLDSMKYTELRSLAKELGLKANMKADKLLKAIKQHYQEEKNKEAKEQGQDINDEAQEKPEVVLDSSCKEEVSSTTGFVNTRRGKGQGTKRKISVTATLTKSDAKMPPVAAKDDTEVDAPTAPCNARGGKKRKVSSTIDKEKNEPPKKIQTPNREEQQLQPTIKDEAPVTAETEKAPKGAKAGRIPRLQQKSKPLLKPVTPNFKKLHEAHFNKMESIDSYVQRKTKQMETYRNSVKELKSLSDKTKLLQVDGKAQVRANPTRVSMFSPAPVNKTPGGENRRHTLLSATKKPLAKEVVSFRPSVLSTRRINVRFSEATHDNEYKRSLVKTPARMSPCMASSTPEKQTANELKPSSVKTASFSATKTPGPFVFTGNTSTSTTPGTNKKPSFDLKASLSRPLTYKPHKGKLKPFGDVKENTAMNKSISNPHQEAYKQHKVQSREGRRANQVQDRKQKKESMLGARRGLVMA
ncbi:MHC class I antigen [Sarotherodon galilaeus]